MGPVLGVEGPPCGVVGPAWGVEGPPRGVGGPPCWTGAGLMEDAGVGGPNKLSNAPIICCKQTRILLNEKLNILNFVE